MVLVERSFSASKTDVRIFCNINRRTLKTAIKNAAYLLASNPYSRSPLSGAVACLLLVLSTLALSPLRS
jgi:hypothetical protein